MPAIAPGGLTNVSTAGSPAAATSASPCAEAASCAAPAGASPAAGPSLAPVVMRKAAPAIQFKDADGAEHTIGEWKGKFTVLMFFSVTCAVCQKEVPSMQAFLTQYGPNVAVVPIEATGASATDVAAFKSTYQVPMPIYHDPGRRAAGAFLVKNYPNSFILSPDGVVQEDLLGHASLTFYSARLALYAPQFYKPSAAPSPAP